MRPGTLLRLAVAGTRADTMRIVLTAVGSVLGCLALLCAATVLSIRAPLGELQEDGTRGESYAPYTNGLLREAGLRPGLAFALVLLTIPVLLFVGQCARLGAPARDRRLAAIRLAGATPGQGRSVAAAESGLATFLGTLVGLLGYLVGRRLLDAPNRQGLRPLPTDVLPPWWALAAVVLGLPLIATLATALLLRRATVTPLGVVRTVRTGSPKPWPGVLIAIGVLSFLALDPVSRYLGRHGHALPDSAWWVLPLLLFVAGLCAALGVVTGAGWIAYNVGRLLGRYARRPAALIAGRRLQSDPWSGSRALAALLTAVLFAAGAAWVTSSFRAQQLLEDRGQRELDRLAGVPDDPGYFVHDDFYLRAMQLIGYAVLVAAVIAAAGLMVTVANSIVERRRSLASLTASGVPRSVLGRAVLWQSLAVAVPAILLALATGVALGRGIGGPTVASSESQFGKCVPPADQPDACASPDLATHEKYMVYVDVPALTERVPVPWSDLGVIAEWALGATVLTSGLGLLFLRASSSPEELRTA